MAKLTQAVVAREVTHPIGHGDGAHFTARGSARTIGPATEERKTALLTPVKQFSRVGAVADSPYLPAVASRWRGVNRVAPEIMRPFS